MTSLTSWPNNSIKLRVEVEREKRRRQREREERQVLVDQCASDAAYFIHEYVIIDDAQDQGGETGTMPFHLWPAQRGLLSDIAHERLLLILKARQLGISWLCCAYALWLCLFRPGRLVLIFSKGQDEANEMLRRVTAMYQRLPEALREALPAVVKQNTEAIEWANGSRIKSMPATKSGGRTYTASLIILDEFAFIQWARELYTALKPTIDAGGQLVLLSTANGTGNLFYEIVERARKGVGRFVFRFLDWRARPGRDDAWYAATAADSVQSSLMGQEYPANADEAFEATNNERFMPSMLLWDACKEILPPLDEHEPMVLAADAGVSNDLFALVGTTRHPERHEDVAVRYVRTWKAPPGGQLNFDEIEMEVRHVCSTYNVVQLTYDPYQLHQMMTRLQNDTVVWTSEFGQQGERLEADKQLLDLAIQRRLAHDGNPELRQAVDNADRKIDPESRKIRIVKRAETLKIDPTVACSMSAKRCLDLNL